MTGLIELPPNFYVKNELSKWTPQELRLVQLDARRGIPAVIGVTGFRDEWAQGSVR